MRSVFLAAAVAAAAAAAANADGADSSSASRVLRTEGSLPQLENAIQDGPEAVGGRSLAVFAPLIEISGATTFYRVGCDIPAIRPPLDPTAVVLAPLGEVTIFYSSPRRPSDLLRIAPDPFAA